MLTFDYTDAKGKQTKRVVYHDGMLDSIKVLDLTEFEPDERDFYAEELARLHEAYLDRIRMLGLKTCWRNFKLSQIKNPTKYVREAKEPKDDLQDEVDNK